MRTGAGPLKAAEDNGAVLSPWHPVTLNETGEGDCIREVLEPIARHHNATIQQAALAWHLHHSAATLPISGTTSPDHLQEHLTAGAIHRTPKRLRRSTPRPSTPEQPRKPVPAAINNNLGAHVR